MHSCILLINQSLMEKKMDANLFIHTYMRILQNAINLI